MAAVQKIKQNGPAVIGLRDEDMTIDEKDADETMTIGEETTEDEEFEESEDEDGEESQEGSVADDDDWMPSREVSPQPKNTKTSAKGNEVSGALRPLSMNRLQDDLRTLRIDDDHSFSDDELNESFKEELHEEPAPKR